MKERGKIMNVTEQRLIKLISDILGENDVIQEREITLEDSLEALGLNSMSFVQVVVAAEEVFDITFDDMDLVSDNFETVRDLYNNIDKLLEV